MILHIFANYVFNKRKYFSQHIDSSIKEANSLMINPNEMEMNNLRQKSKEKLFLELNDPPKSNHCNL